MRKKQFIAEFSRKLADLGWSRAQISRTAQEMNDHWDDLEEEGRESGSIPDQFAAERMGTADSLARLQCDCMRSAHWCGRHPILSFALLPPLALLVWFMAWALMAVGAGGLYSKMLGLPHLAWSRFFVVLITAKVVHYTGLFVIPALFCWWARRSFCGYKWSWIACMSCAAHGLINHVTVQSHSLSWGYGIAVPDLIPVFAPLIVAATAQFYHRMNWRVACGVAVLLLTGCSSTKPTLERGWIGGEYKTLRSADGILISRLQTNSPAARSGLREGDLIKEVDGQRVKELQAFWHLIDEAPPGTSLVLAVSRDGNPIRKELIVGRERFKADHSIVIGLLFAHEFDPVPNPDFSLVALGFKQQHQRVDLDSPEWRLERSLQPQGKSVRSREGWEMWLPIASFSSRKAILSQSVAE